MSKNQEGIIIGIAGPVVNVRFEGETPLVHEALEIELSGKEKLVLETALINGDHEVKALAMGSTDGLTRGMKVRRTHSN
jgi:F-type H+-transporting ATPase subunit beta